MRKEKYSSSTQYPSTLILSSFITVFTLLVCQQLCYLILFSLIDWLIDIDYLCWEGKSQQGHWAQARPLGSTKSENVRYGLNYVILAINKVISFFTKTILFTTLPIDKSFVSFFRLLLIINTCRIIDCIKDIIPILVCIILQGAKKVLKLALSSFYFVHEIYPNRSTI